MYKRQKKVISYPIAVGYGEEAGVTGIDDTENDDSQRKFYVCLLAGVRSCEAQASERERLRD